MDCICPRPAALPNILRVLCPENMGQVNRLGIQRGGYQFDANAAPTPNLITDFDSWEDLITAVNNDKLVITPVIDSPNFARAEKLTRGGNDNTTQNGVQQLLGFGSVPFTGLLTNVPVKIIEALTALMCELDLVFYGFTNSNRIVCRELDPVANPGDVYGGIPIEPMTLAVSYPDAKGFANVDEATFDFFVTWDWAKNRAIIEPDFNIKTQLLAPAA